MHLSTPKFFGTATLAKAVRKSRVTIERKLRAGEIQPDAEFVTPAGQRYALFDESRLRNLALLLTA
jgi:hypothetical protein